MKETHVEYKLQNILKGINMEESQQASDLFLEKAELYNQRRITVLSEINMLKQLYTVKSNCMEETEDAGAILAVADWKGFVSVLNLLYNHILQLDDNRLEQVQELARMYNSQCKNTPKCVEEVLNWLCG